MFTYSSESINRFKLSGASMTPHSQPVGAPERHSGDLNSDLLRDLMARAEEGFASGKSRNAVLNKWLSDYKICCISRATHPMPQGIAEAIDVLRCGPEIRMNKTTRCREEDWEDFQEKAYKITDMLESATQRLALMESQLPRMWQNMDTAPKDGSYVLLYLAAEDENDSPSVFVAAFLGVAGEWFEKDSSHYLDFVFDAWMKLPPLPIEGEVR